MVSVQECFKLDNFDSAMEIVSGLNSTPVNLLAQKWELSPASQETVNKISSFFLDSNSQGYRARLKTVGPPCVPFLGVYLRVRCILPMVLRSSYCWPFHFTEKDLTFIEEGNPDELTGGLVNFYKCAKLAETIRQIQKFQVASIFCMILYHMLDGP